MKTLISWIAVVIALSSVNAEAQYPTNIRPIELTSRGVAVVSPASDEGWRSVAPLQVAYRQPVPVVPATVSPITYTAMPIQRPATWVGYPQTVRYGMPGTCQTIPVAQLVPPTVPVAAVAPQAGYYFGKGILGQPKLYVQGQPVRNALRYLTF